MGAAAETASSASSASMGGPSSPWRAALARRRRAGPRGATGPGRGRGRRGLRARELSATSFIQPASPGRRRWPAEGPGQRGVGAKRASGSASARNAAAKGQSDRRAETARRRARGRAHTALATPSLSRPSTSSQTAKFPLDGTEGLSCPAPAWKSSAKQREAAPMNIPNGDQFAGSREYLQRASHYLAGGVNSNFRLGISPTPLAFDHAEGAVLVDVDGNRLIDYYLGMGPMILGHRRPRWSGGRGPTGARHPGGRAERSRIRRRRRLAGMVPSAERMRFCSSGSEAVQGAIRLARAVTGRPASSNSKATTTAGSTTSCGRCCRLPKRPAPELPEPVAAAPGNWRPKPTRFACCRGTTAKRLPRVLPAATSQPSSWSR